MTEMQVGESTTREGLPDEVFLRVMRRADAEQNRHLNLARIAKALEEQGSTRSEGRIARSLERIADALDRAFPVPPPEEPARNEAGMPTPPWASEPSTVTEEYHEDSLPPWKRKRAEES